MRWKHLALAAVEAGAEREHICCTFVYATTSCPAGLCKCWERLIPGYHLDAAKLFHPLHDFAGLDTVES
ncbi:hypothetical protein C5167_008755 [Papaver somniferum]|uniref:Uncharacterized protein n=1 Tax=Papaver somniferum TaxID=3469 RepID=A0A4Y7JYK4_PAPSO|nr:hypothetical protein C5167_008755 [Papaver somniferum]